MSFHRIKPILFNTEMVRAILDGRKTVTRRVIKPHYKDGDAGFRINRRTVDGVITGVEYYDEEECGTGRYVQPPYQVGDILYVRETWCRGTDIWNCEKTSPEYFYKEEFRDASAKEIKWRPSIHMPKEAARIWLKVTDVRVERLQDITEDDVCKEGAEPLIQCDREHGTYNSDGTLGDMCWNTDECSYCPFEKSYSELFGKMVWNSTIKKQDIDSYGWDANPWVWVIEFERIER